MQIYNTANGKKEEFIPSRAGFVSMYVCGITTYDYSHIGHARSAVAFDIWLRLLRYKGFDVFFVRNFTDIDDKILAKATKEGIAWEDISQKYIQAYHEDMEALQILSPTVEPKATEHIEDMIQGIATLIEKGFAYSTHSGDVYYRVRLCKEYGILSGHSVDSLYNNVRIESSSEKEDALDFALWKSAKEGEPFWESPWGNGRPGWHIECSAMSKKYLELPIDIHGGGRDLIFPHHENEKAQTESMCDCSFVRYWVHNGFVQIDSEKMSKSLNNFTTVRDIYRDYLPEVLRYFLLTKHYRSPIDFTLEAMREAEKNLHTIYSAKKMAIHYIQEYENTQLLENTHGYKEEYLSAKQNFFTCIEDDCNTACGLGYIFGMVHCVHKVLNEKKKTQEALLIAKEFLQDIEQFHSILGVFGEEAQSFLYSLRTRIARRLHVNEQHVEERILERITARMAKDFVKADAIRDELTKEGIAIMDTPRGTEWDFE